jgi:hypothetical protein
MGISESLATKRSDTAGEEEVRRFHAVSAGRYLIRRDG